MDLLDVDTVESGLFQGTYLLETMRRLLVDGSMSMDLERIPKQDSVDSRSNGAIRVCIQHRREAPGRRKT